MELDFQRSDIFGAASLGAAQDTVESGKRNVVDKSKSLNDLNDAGYDTTMAEIMLAAAQSALSEAERKVNRLNNAE